LHIIGFPVVSLIVVDCVCFLYFDNCPQEDYNNKRKKMLIRGARNIIAKHHHQFATNFKPNHFQQRYYAASGKANTLVVVEHANNKLSSACLPTITAAKQLGNVTAIVFTHDNNKSVAEEVGKIDGVNKVVVVNHSAFEHKIAERLYPVLANIQQKNKYSHILAPHSIFGKDLLPRVAAALDVSPITDILRIDDDNTFVRPIYAGNALSTVSSSDEVKVITVRPTAFDKAASGSQQAEIVTEDAQVENVDKTPQWISEEIVKSDRPELASARVVVSGGRGLKSGDNFKILYDLADKLGGAVGATRAAVDDGYVSNDLQVGQTGKVVAPELYIAVGVSGAIQHLAGMKDSKTIVAINKDAEAPIFQVADYGLVADLFTAVPEITQKV
jgi:electron transfer flavoprotein alpha subunit